jgi:hypothetical protein
LLLCTAGFDSLALWERVFGARAADTLLGPPKGRGIRRKKALPGSRALCGKRRKRRTICVA